MIAGQTEQVLVVLTGPPALESQLIDWLLSRDSGLGFSSSAVHGHSTRHDHLSIAEQVTGWQRRLQFQVQLDRSLLERFIAQLAEEFTGTDLHYWVIPLLAGGDFPGDRFRPGTGSFEP